jgi:Na+-driven multidrug efflux pump
MAEQATTHDEELRRLYLSTTPTRLFFIAAAPGAVSMLASALYDVLDGIIVGQLLGSTAFAAVNLAMPFVILAFAVGDLVGVGSAVPIAIALGAGDDDRANNVFTCAVLGIVLLGAMLGATFWFAAPGIMRVLHATGPLADDAVIFLRVYAAGAPITSLMFALDNFLRICGKIRGSLMLNVFMAILGAIIEFSLVRFAGLGVMGAALGYCLALAISACVGMVPFLRGSLKLRFVRPRPHAELVRQITAAGMPAFLNNVAGRVPSVLLNAALLAMGGEDAVAVYGALMYASGVIFPLLYGTCDSLQPAVGYNLGAGRVDRVVKIEKRIFAACAVISVSVAVAMFAFPLQFTHLFIGNPSKSILTLAESAFRLFSIAYFVRWLPMATQSFYTAIERPKPASAFSLLESLVAPILALVLLWPLGLTGLWLNLPVATLASASVASVMLVRLRKDLRGEL